MGTEYTNVSVGDKVIFSVSRSGYRFTGCTGKVVKVKKDQFNRNIVTVKDDCSGENIDIHPETSDIIQPVEQKPKKRPIGYEKPKSPSYRKQESTEDPRREFLRRYRKGRNTSMGRLTEGEADRVLRESILDEVRGGSGRRVTTGMYDDSDPWGEFEPPECPQCGGPGTPLGRLGQLMHYRCRNCGWDFSDEDLMGEGIEEAAAGAACPKCGATGSMRFSHETHIQCSKCGHRTSLRHHSPAGKREDHATMNAAQKPDDYDNDSTRKDADADKSPEPGNPRDYRSLFRSMKPESAMRDTPVQAMVDMVLAGRIRPDEMAGRLLDEGCGMAPPRRRRRKR